MMSMPYLSSCQTSKSNKQGEVWQIHQQKRCSCPHHLFLIISYLLVRIHQKYVLAALEAKKHVLLNDPVSISMQAFEEQLAFARKFGKFCQSSTPFVHQHRARKFIQCVLREDVFGRVTSMDAHLSLCSKDLPLVEIPPNQECLGKNQGCIRRLGRYCVLFSILIFTRLKSYPISAQVHSAVLDKKPPRRKDDEDKDNDTTTSPGEPIKAQGTIKFSDVSSFRLGGNARMEGMHPISHLVTSNVGSENDVSCRLF
jgi:hypothetical protein